MRIFFSQILSLVMLFKTTVRLKAFVFPRVTCTLRTSTCSRSTSEDTEWLSVKLPKSMKTLAVREVVDTESYIDKAIKNDSIEPFGVVTWHAAYIAATMLDERFSGSEFSLRGKTVVDLGCGTGLASVAALALGMLFHLLKPLNSCCTMRIPYYKRLSENYFFGFK